jgi:hypothetical protein
MLPPYKLKICQHGSDGFGHQLEGMLRIISLSLNDKAEYVYNLKTGYTFEHSNFNVDLLNSYLLNALQTLSQDPSQKTNLVDQTYKVFLGENRTFENIIANDADHSNNIYCYDGVGCGRFLPSNFEHIDEFMKSLPKLRNAFVLNNPFLPKPSYDRTKTIIVCHIRLGDAVGTRLLDTDALFEFIKKKQFDKNNQIIIHSDGNVDFLKSDNTVLFDRTTDVLQVLSDFIHADMLIMNYSALSIAAHLLADENQSVFCPNVAGPTFCHRIMKKCKKISDA